MIKVENICSILEDRSLLAIFFLTHMRNMRNEDYAYETGTIRIKSEPSTKSSKQIRRVDN